ncbi:hypothetical protein LUZ60_004219 [Juncus effusus]|nr:hypothetical protein LUZ60_004219 [Juncus effusus]
MIVFIFFSCFLCLFHPSIASNNSAKDDLDVYIVLVKDPDGAKVGQHHHTESWHKSLLSTVIPDYSSKFIYSYNRVANGFAARLTKSEVESLSKQDWFIKSFPAGTYKPATTHSSFFLGLQNSNKKSDSVWNSTNMGEGIIIGVLDTGISPGHPSFRDEGLPPPPAKWKGHCDFNASVCNNKLIGARTIVNASGDLDHFPPTDILGHGTHVSSTAAGAFVNHAGVLGSGVGTASGVAPRAHLAFYKICAALDKCSGADLLKAIEIAVDDGVDVISMSFTASDDEALQLKGVHNPLSTNVISVGAFYAMLHGVFVSCCASNRGPNFGTIDNDFPWLLTVGASTTDRRFSSTVELGNGVQINGEALSQPKSWGEDMKPLIYLRTCEYNLDKRQIQGKIVVCGVPFDLRWKTPQQADQLVIDAGAAGLIIINDRKLGAIKTLNILPTTYVNYDDAVKIISYIRSSPKASATFRFKGSVTNLRSPVVGGFSSRGPSNKLPRILKPDIVGPGVDILAAYPPDALVDEGAAKSLEFTFMSGTSMSAPHLAGVGALIKKAHPDWSTAAIKSSIMTTAYVIDRSGKSRITNVNDHPADFYSLGAGHVDPKKAMDPGLVYDMKPEEYIPFLCGLRLTDEEVKTIISPLPAVKCSRVKSISQEQLNYPSMVVSLKLKSTMVIQRTVKNVGDAKSTYTAKIDVPNGVSARVTPAILCFNKKNEMKSFNVSFTWNKGQPAYEEGQLSWISSSTHTQHIVRSPIVINKAFSNGSTVFPNGELFESGY